MLGDFIPFSIVFAGNIAIVVKIFASKRLRSVTSKDDKGSRKVRRQSPLWRIYWKLDFRCENISYTAVWKYNFRKSWLKWEVARRADSNSIIAEVAVIDSSTFWIWLYLTLTSKIIVFHLLLYSDN